MYSGNPPLPRTETLPQLASSRGMPPHGQFNRAAKDCTCATTASVQIKTIRRRRSAFRAGGKRLYLTDADGASTKVARGCFARSHSRSSLAAMRSWNTPLRLA